MEWGTIPEASIIGMVFSLITSIGLPTVLGLLCIKRLMRKYHPVSLVQGYS